MFKRMLLRPWHGLSGTQPEQALCVHIDFMIFTGFDSGAGELLDTNAICRIRKRLAKGNAHTR